MKSDEPRYEPAPLNWKQGDNQFIEAASIDSTMYRIGMGSNGLWALHAVYTPIQDPGDPNPNQGTEFRSLQDAIQAAADLHERAVYKWLTPVYEDA